MGFETVMAIGASTLLGLAVAVIAALRGWNGWLELKKLELANAYHRDENATPYTGGRIEIADLKERVRKLELIASGIDL
jgi:hypothetical protein